MLYCSEIQPSDMRLMLRLAIELEQPRPMPQQLTTLLVGLCEMTKSDAAVAVEVQYLPRLQRESMPLIEVSRGTSGRRPRRTPLVGTASLASYRLSPQDRARRVEAGFGVQSWGRIGLASREVAEMSTMHALQMVEGRDVGIGVVLVRQRDAIFTDRDITILNTTWRSNRFAVRNFAADTDPAVTQNLRSLSGSRGRASMRIG